MPEFIESRFPVEISYGSGFSEEYAVEIDTTANGNEYRRLRHPHPRVRYDVSYAMREQDWVLDEVLDFYHRTFGRFVGFRVRNLADYSSNGYTGTPTPTDQVAKNLSATTWQLQKTYGLGGSPASIGRPVRIIYKPVTGSVLMSASGATIPGSNYVVDTTTGIVTFIGTNSRTIAGIVRGATTKILTTIAPSFQPGDTIVCSGISGTTQLNGLRATITAVDSAGVTVSVNSTGFGAWTSGGTVQDNPVATETVAAGFQFDLPMRFDSDLSQLSFDTFETLSASGINLVEILNP